ncbi:glycosyl hydrolases family 18-domain-containing protein [Jimgerdemannia flammicorona]|uniref:Glycosyl hydrolases family 18-domain-containing protein n=1 Tax=Jimgerdemannia flammicorona TaxID=994334 RepID=A0A433QZU2_9FUNG|nr:glycosyl hydrolases family 18-domain-containing protein [Jimgerdemannia flammicorona]
MACRHINSPNNRSMKSLFAIALLGAVFTEASAKAVLVGYLPNWLYASYPVANIDYSKYTHINYAFAIANDASGTPKWADDYQVSVQLPEVVKGAHAKGSKVLISIGGWSGCIAFSTIVASASARKTFIDWNIKQITTYNTDGVDIDWEYPGRQGAGCNAFDVKNDTPNLLILLKELRAALNTNFKGAKKEITMANRAVPFETPSGPSKDVSAFVPYVDRFQLMLYDINGAWNSTTGPNAPFKNQNGWGAPFSYTDGIQAWRAAGVPAGKIVAGLAYYGHSIKATVDMTKTGFQYQACATSNPLGDSDDASWQDPYCSKDPGGTSGIWKWKNLRSQGVLTSPTTAGAGWTRYFDSVSQTPWLFNPSTKIFISYDDPVSLKTKINYALCQKLGGVMVWDIHQDNGELLTAVNNIQGSAPSSCATPGPGPKPKTSKITGKIATNTATATKTKAGKGSKKPKTITAMTSEDPKPTSPGSDCSSSNAGQSVCTNPGKDVAYKQCLNGSWIQRQCSPGTVCNAAGSNDIQCGLA